MYKVLEFDHFDSLGCTHWIFNQDKGTFLVTDMKGFLASKDSTALVKSLFCELGICGGNWLWPQQLGRYIFIIEPADLDTVFLAVYDKARAIVATLNQLSNDSREIRTFIHNTFTDIGTHFCIGIIHIWGCLGAVRTEYPFCIVVKVGLVLFPSQNQNTL